MSLKRVFSWLMSVLGFFIILSGLGMITTSFFVNALNIDDLKMIYDSNFDNYLTNNIEKIKAEQNIPNITPDQLPLLREGCKTAADNLFCNEDFLSGKITADEVIKQTIKSQMSFEKTGLQQAIAPIEQMKQKVSMVYGIVLFIIGVLFVFISKSFNTIQSIKSIAYESAFGSVISAVSFKAMPYLMQKLISVKIAGMAAAESELVSLVSNTMIEWMRAALDNAFIICLILTGVFAVIYVIVLIIHKKSSEESLAI